MLAIMVERCDNPNKCRKRKRVWFGSKEKKWSKDI